MLVKPWAIAVEKPTGVSSYDVVREFKRNIPREQLKKIGHLGTLDPFASGLMLVTACGGSRIQEYSHKFLYKTYIASGKFGEKTNTGDCEGTIIESDNGFDLVEKDWPKQFDVFKRIFFNDYYQKIPAFSATKHQGKKLYELARQGKSVEKPPVLRFLRQLEFINFDRDKLTFIITCSGGTYIRQLFEDMCEVIGTVGHLTELRRTKIGNVSIDQAIDLTQIKEREFGQLKQVDFTEILPIQTVVFDEDQVMRLVNGQEAFGEESEFADRLFSCWFKELAWSLNRGGDLLGLVKRTGRDNKFVPKINFACRPI